MAIQLPYTDGIITPSGVSNVESKDNKGQANGYAPLDANAKVPTANLPDAAALDAEVAAAVSAHNSATTNVHGIANTANLVTAGVQWTDRHSNATGNPYVVGSVVYFSGRVYRCLANNDSIEPQQGGNAYWADLGVGYLLPNENPKIIGGSIDTHGEGAQGGYIDTHGEEVAGGYINTSASGSATGGYINTSGATGTGGNIDTSSGGGSINTRGVGSIQLGVSGTRTTLVGTASANRSISLPNNSGTISLEGHTHAISNVTNLQTNLDDKQKIFYTYNSSSFSATLASTADQWQATIAIPGGLLGTKGYVSVKLWASCSASASAKRLRAYVTSTNPGNAIGGTRICNYNSTSSSTPSTVISLMRQLTIINRGSQSSQIIEPSASGGASSTTSTDAFEEVAINTANTWYLVIGLQKDNTGDAFQLKQVFVEGVYAT